MFGFHLICVHACWLFVKQTTINQCVHSSGAECCIYLAYKILILNLKMVVFRFDLFGCFALPIYWKENSIISESTFYKLSFEKFYFFSCCSLCETRPWNSLMLLMIGELLSEECVCVLNKHVCMASGTFSPLCPPRNSPRHPSSHVWRRYRVLHPSHNPPLLLHYRWGQSPEDACRYDAAASLWITHTPCRFGPVAMF